MRTLALLAALFLLALQAQAEPVPEKAEEALEEQQPKEEDQGVVAPLKGAEDSGPQDAEATPDAGKLNPDKVDSSILQNTLRVLPVVNRIIRLLPPRRIEPILIPQPWPVPQKPRLGIFRKNDPRPEDEAQQEI